MGLEKIVRGKTEPTLTTPWGDTRQATIKIHMAGSRQLPRMEIVDLNAFFAEVRVRDITRSAS